VGVVVLPGETFAVVGAGFADFRANPTGPGVELRAANHKVGAGLANLDAILHQPDMVGGGVGTTHTEAVGDGFEAGPVTIGAVLDTFLHLGAHRGVVVWHKNPLSSSNLLNWL
jgi:hypothetical protein